MDAGVDTVVIGAGVVGLAIARELSLAGHEVVVVEAEPSFGRHASSRNSEVIHAGIYHPPHSEKARLCREGRARLLHYCRARGVPHRMVGKLIVANGEAERARLGTITANARACEAPPLHHLDRSTLRSTYPGLSASAALWSPHTGIVDSHALMQALAADAEDAGAQFAWRTRVERLGPGPLGWCVRTASETLHARQLINAAGHGAQALAATLPLQDISARPRYLVKGTYARLKGPAPFPVLVYPVPDTASLGVHLTVDLRGRPRFGPDQEWVERHEYQVDADRIERFYPAIRRYWPALPDGALAPDYAGIRVRTRGPDGPPGDFEIQTPAEHGHRGLVQLFGIESPGLTAALAIARRVADSFAETR